MPRVFGLTTTARSAAYTEVALQSFFASTSLSPDDTLLVVDNDGQFVPPAGLPREHLLVIRPDRPQGFARNLNLVLRVARERNADFYLLHNDLLFTRGWLEPLESGGEHAISVSVCNRQYPYALDGLALAPTMVLEDLAGRAAVVERIAALHKSKVAGRRAVAAPALSCARIPAAVLAAVGEFDDRFGTRGAEDRDYCVRAWLAGCPVELALESFVLHFGGRFTAQAGEASTRGTARQDRSGRAFLAKWGPTLTYAVTGEDWNLFRPDPEVAAALAERRFDRAIARVRDLPSLDPFVERQRHARFAAVCVVYEDDSWLPHTLEPVYDLCDSIWFMVNDRPWYGEATDQAPMLERIRQLPDPDHKFRIVQGHWQDEIEPRNEAMDRLQQAGVDYCLVLDADEIWDPQVLAAAMTTVRGNPQIVLWRAGCYTYWKSHAYRVDPPEPYRAVVFLRVGGGRFHYSRDALADTQAVFPIEQTAFHHMSYARSDEVVRRKIDGCTHKLDVVPGWFENVWLGWDQDHAMENVHPCWPAAYKRVIPQPYEALPPVLRRLRDAEVGASSR
jgi:GT2 family glycosyltransferase